MSARRARHSAGAGWGASRLALRGGLAALAAGGGLLGLRAALALGVTLLARAGRLAALLGRIGIVRDRRGPRLAHALLAQALVLLVVFDGWSVILRHTLGLPEIPAIFTTAARTRGQGPARGR